MATPNRIVIQLNDAGTAVLGISSTDLGGLPAPLTDAQFAALFPGLNVAALEGVAVKEAALATKDAERTTALAAKDSEKATALAAVEAEKAAAITAAAAEKAAVVAERDAAHTALAEVQTLANSAEDEELKAALEAKANDGLRSATNKEKAALEAKIAADQARLDELNGRGGGGGGIRGGPR